MAEYDFEGELGDRGEPGPGDDDRNDDDPGPFSPPLPLADRIWRHPSEFALEADAGRRTRSMRALTRGAVGGAMVGGAMVGAVAVGAVWLAVGSATGVRLATERVSLAPVETVQPLVVPAEEWPVVVATFAQEGTAAVQVDGQTAILAAAVAYRDDGYLLTSARAISGYENLVIVTADGTVYEAEVVGHDLVTDISVLRVKAPLTPVVVAEGGRFTSGDRIAIVDPMGSPREGTILDEATSAAMSSGDWLIGLATIDAQLGDTPPGSPVVDDTGAVAGITTATGPGEDAAVVPIDVARNVASELVADGWAAHAKLGVTARDVTTAEQAEALPAGALVTSVESDGPAAAAGIETGDVIVVIAGEPVVSLAAMVAVLRHHEPGDEVIVEARRGGEVVSLPVELDRHAGAWDDADDPADDPAEGSDGAGSPDGGDDPADGDDPTTVDSSEGSDGADGSDGSEPEGSGANESGAGSDESGAASDEIRLPAAA